MLNVLSKTEMCTKGLSPQNKQILPHSSPLKTTKPGKSVTLKFDCLPNKALCTKCTLAAYISRTKALRGNGPNDFVFKLFISYIKAHKPISTDTLSRWIKLVLASAGIDTSVFKAHSVRGAATSHAYAKVFELQRFCVLLIGLVNGPFENII